MGRLTPKERGNTHRQPSYPHALGGHPNNPKIVSHTVSPTGLMRSSFCGDVAFALFPLSFPLMPEFERLEVGFSTLRDRHLLCDNSLPQER